MLYHAIGASTCFSSSGEMAFALAIVSTADTAYASSSAPHSRNSKPSLAQMTPPARSVAKWALLLSNASFRISRLTFIASSM